MLWGQRLVWYWQAGEIGSTENTYKQAYARYTNIFLRVPSLIKINISRGPYTTNSYRWFKIKTWMNDIEDLLFTTFPAAYNTGE